MMVMGRDDSEDTGAANYNPEAPGEPNPALHNQPAPPVPGVHKETRGHRTSPGSGSEGTGHTGGGGGRDSH